MGIPISIPEMVIEDPRKQSYLTNESNLLHCCERNGINNDFYRCIQEILMLCKMTLHSPPPSELVQRKDEMNEVITELHNEFKKPYFPESYQMSNTEYLFSSYDFTSLENRKIELIKPLLQGIISQLQTLTPLSLFDQLFPRSIKSGDEVIFDPSSVKSNGRTKSTSVLQDNDDVWFTSIIEASKTVYWEGSIMKGSIPIIFMTYTEPLHMRIVVSSNDKTIMINKVINNNCTIITFDKEDTILHLKFIFSCLDSTMPFSLNIKRIQLFGNSDKSPNDVLFQKHMNLVYNIRDIEPILSLEALLLYSQSSGSLNSFLMLFHNILTNKEQSLWDTIKSRCIKHIKWLKSEKKKILLKGFDNDMLFRRSLNVSFDAKHSSSGIEFISPYTITMTATQKNAYSLLNIPMSRNSVYIWTFQLDHDSIDNETSGFGVSTTLYPSSTSFSSSDTWLFKSYNASIYHGSKCYATSNPPVHEGDILTITLNLISYYLLFSINGGKGFGVFHLDSNSIYYPCVLLYGHSQVSLLSFYCYDNPIIPHKVNSMSSITYTPKAAEYINPININGVLRNNSSCLTVGCDGNADKYEINIKTENLFSMRGYLGIHTLNDNMSFEPGTCDIDIIDDKDTLLFTSKVEPDDNVFIEIKLTNIESITIKIRSGCETNKFIFGIYDAYFMNIDQAKLINSIDISDEPKDIISFVKDELSLINDTSIYIPRSSIYLTPNLPLWYSLSDDVIVTLNELLKLFNSSAKQYVLLYEELLILLQSNFREFITQNLDPLQCGLWVDKNNTYILTDNMNEFLTQLTKGTKVLPKNDIKLVIKTIVEGYLLLFPSNRSRVNFLLKHSDNPILPVLLSQIPKSPLILSSFFLDLDKNMKYIMELFKTLLQLSQEKFIMIIDLLFSGEEISELQDQLKAITKFLVLFQSHFLVEVKLIQDKKCIVDYTKLVLKTVSIIANRVADAGDYSLIEYNLIISPAGRMMNDLLIYIYSHYDNTDIADGLLESVISITKQWDEVFHKIDDNFNKNDQITIAQNEISWETKDFRSTPYNINLSIQNGNSDVLTGDYGYSFIPKEDLIIYSLGRAVSLTDGERILHRPHVIKLLQDSVVIGIVTVDQYSNIDTLGYAYENLPFPLYLNKDVKYQICCGEAMQCGDVWFNNPNYSKILNYRSNLVDILEEKNEKLKDDKQERDNQIQNNTILISYGTSTFYVLKKSEFIPPILPPLHFQNLTEDEINISIGPSVQQIDCSDYRYVFTSPNNNIIIDYIIQIKSVQPNSELLFGFTNQLSNKEDEQPYGYCISTNGYLLKDNEKIICQAMDLELGSLIHVRINTSNGNMMVNFENTSYGYVFANTDMNPLCRIDINGPISLLFFLKGNIEIEIYFTDIVHDNKIPFYYECERTLTSVCGLLCNTSIASLPIDDEEEKVLQWDNSYIIQSGPEVTVSDTKGIQLPPITVDPELQTIVTNIIDLKNETGTKIYEWFDKTFKQNMIFRAKPNIPIERLFLGLLIKQCHNIDDIQLLISYFKEPRTNIECIKNVCQEIWKAVITLRRYIDGKYNDFKQDDPDNWEKQANLLVNNITDKLRFLLTFTSCRDEKNSTFPNRKEDEKMDFRTSILTARKNESKSNPSTPSKPTLIHHSSSKKLLIENSQVQSPTKQKQIYLNQFHEVTHLHQTLSVQDTNKVDPVYNQTLAIITECMNIFITDNAPDLKLLNHFIGIRKERAMHRHKGLESLSYLLDNLKSDIGKYEVLRYVRPAFRGAINEEKFNIINAITSKHHYLTNLYGVPTAYRKLVGNTFWKVFDKMVKMMQNMIEKHQYNGTLFYTILWCLTLDYQDKDFTNLLQYQLPQTLKKFSTISSLIDQVSIENKNKEICYTPDLFTSNWNIRNLPPATKLLELISNGKITLREIKGLLQNQMCLDDFIDGLGKKFCIKENCILTYSQSIQIITKALENCEVSNDNENKYNGFNNKILKSFIFRMLSDYCCNLQNFLMLNTFSIKHDLNERRPDLITNRDRYDLSSPLDLFGWNKYIKDFLMKEFTILNNYYTVENDITSRVLEQMEVEKRMSGLVKLISLNQSGDFHTGMIKDYLDLFILGIMHGLPPLKHDIMKYLQITLLKMKCPGSDYFEKLIKPFLMLIGYLYSINGELYGSEDKSIVIDELMPPGQGYTHQILACDTVTFIRQLLQEQSWKDASKSYFQALLNDIQNTVNHYLKTSKVEDRLSCIFGVLSVLGGFTEVYREGGKAIYKPTNEIGTIISYDPYINDIGLLFSENYADEVYHYNKNDVIVCNTINPPNLTDILDINSAFDLIQTVLSIDATNQSYNRENRFIIHSLKYKIIKIVGDQSNNAEFNSKLLNNDVIMDYLVNQTTGLSYIPILSKENREMLINQLHQQILELSNELTTHNPQEPSIKCSKEEFDLGGTLQTCLKGFSLNECIQSLKNNNDNKLLAVSDLLNLVLVSVPDKYNEPEHKFVSELGLMVLKLCNLPDYICDILVEMMDNNPEKLNQIMLMISLVNLQYPPEPNKERIQYTHIYKEKDMWFDFCTSKCDFKCKTNYDNHYNIHYSPLPEDKVVKKGTVVSFTSEDNNNNIYAEKTGRVVQDTEAKRDVTILFYNPLTGMKWKETCSFDRLSNSTMKDGNIVNKQATISQIIAYISSLERYYSQKILLNLLTNDTSYQRLIVKIKQSPTDYLMDLFSRLMIGNVMNNTLDNTIYETNLFHNLFLWSKDKEFQDKLYDIIIHQILNHIKDNDYTTISDNYVIKESLHPVPIKVSYTGKVHLPGAKRLIIIFDLNTDFGEEINSRLLLSDDEDFTNPITYCGNDGIFPPLVIDGGTVWFRYILSGDKPPWGFRFEVRELPVHKWTTEDDVNSIADRKWGLWLCESLFNSKMKEIYQHKQINIELYTSLIHELKEYGNIESIKMLLLLLSSPDVFPSDYTIDLEPISDVFSVFENFIKNNSYISTRNKYFTEILYHMKNINNQASKSIRTEKPTLENFSFKPQEDIVKPEKKIENYLLYAPLWFRGLHQHYFPEDLFCTSWYLNNYLLREFNSEHPIKDDSFNCTCNIPGAENYRIFFDPRCRLPPKYHLMIMLGQQKQIIKFPYPSVLSVESMGFRFLIAKEENAVFPTDKEYFGISILVDVTGSFSYDYVSQAVDQNKEQILQLYEKMHKWPKEADLEIIKYYDTNKYDGGVHFRQEEGLESKYPLLCSYPQLLRDFRFRLIDEFRVYWKIFYLFVEFSLKYPNCLGNQMKESLYLLPRLQKFNFIASILKENAVTINPVPVLFDSISAKQEESVVFDNPLHSHSMFIQAYLQLKDQPIELFKCNNFFMTVMYKGEEGIDAGGLFRDSITQIVSSIFNPNLKLMLNCGKTGTFVPYPKWKSPSLLNMYKFIGILMGISLRYDLSLPFTFPSLIWKKLLGKTEDISMKDLEFIDPIIVNYIKSIKECSDEDFPYVVDEDTKCVVSNFIGEYEEFIDGGSNIPLTLKNRDEMLDLIYKFRINEFDKQIDSMRDGLYSVIHENVLYFLSVSELEYFICGSQEIDISALKRNTEYEGYNEDDEVINNFWIVMNELNEEQKSSWIYFVWGATRIPCTYNWATKFKIRKAGDISQLPTAHTCFFKVDLPPYGDYETMKKNILLAIEYGSVGMLNQ